MNFIIYVAPLPKKYKLQLYQLSDEYCMAFDLDMNADTLDNAV